MRKHSFFVLYKFNLESMTNPSHKQPLIPYSKSA